MREHKIIDYMSVFAKYAPEMGMQQYQLLMYGIREAAMQNNVTIMTATQTNHNLPPKPILIFHKLRTLKLY